jgi:hypothetical protein
VRLSESGLATPDRTSRSGSGSEGPQGSEAPPSRKRRVNSNVSASEAHYSGIPSISQHPSLDESVTSPSAALDHFSERSPTFSTSPRDVSIGRSRRNSGWIDDAPGSQRHLPSLSDVFDNRSEVNGFPFHRGLLTESPAAVPGLTESKPPSLRKEQSSAGSNSSASSYSYPRTPIEGSLPIHALLGSSKSSHPYDAAQPPLYQSGPISHEPKQPFPRPHVNGSSPSLTNGTRNPYPTLWK